MGKLKPNLPRSWFSLPEREKDAITEVYQKALHEALDHEEAELQKAWLKLACIVLHSQKDPYGKKRCMAFLAKWKRVYRIVGKCKTNAERDAYLDAEMDKIFGKGGYPYKWIDSLENMGER